MHVRDMVKIILVLFTLVSMLPFQTLDTSALEPSKSQPVPPPEPPAPPTVIYYVPHADDEVLTYGVPILNDLRAGKNVIVALLSEGKVSSALAAINQQIEPDMTPEQFGRDRVQEFQLSCKRLSVPEQKCVLYDLESGHFDADKIRKLVLYYEKMFPGATHKGMSQLDYHPDHAMVGRVLHQLKQQGKIKHTEVFASIYMDRFSNQIMNGEVIRLADKRDEVKLKRALEAYKIWDPVEGWHAIGYHSVPKQFDSFQADPYTKKSPF